MIQTSKPGILVKCSKSCVTSAHHENWAFPPFSLGASSNWIWIYELEIIRLLTAAVSDAAYQVMGVSDVGAVVQLADGDIDAGTVGHGNVREQEPKILEWQWSFCFYWGQVLWRKH